jgi:hypothetical protein
MNIESEIWTPQPESDDGDVRPGEVLVEVAGDEEILIHFRVDGEIVASAMLDRFTSGFLAGNLYAAASETVKV